MFFAKCCKFALQFNATMNSKSFSDRLSWRIMGIVVVVSLLTQIVAVLVIADGSTHPKDWLHESSELLVYLSVIGLASLIVLYFVSRGVIRRTIRYGEELRKTTEAKERMESDLTLARDIQRGMLRTDFPPFCHAFINPAKAVGGDFYDFEQQGDYFYFAIGDVSGKGVAASLMMAITRVLLRFVVNEGQPLDVSMGRINDTFSNSNKAGMFVTMFVARLDLKTGHMEYCNAGHLPLLVMPPDAAPYLLKSKPNLVLGMYENFTYEAEQVDFKPGTCIVAYTDGVTEAERKDLTQYGNERLLGWAKGVVETRHGTSLQEQSVVESLYHSVRDFADGNPQNDDITIMSISV